MGKEIDSKRHSCSDQKSSDRATLISIIIPVFNDKPGIERCLKAIAQQAYPIEAIEVIAVDNGSTPPLSLDETFPFRIRVIPCAIPGSYAARNTGAREATGEIWVFIDADCYPDTDWLTQGTRSLLEHQNQSIIGGEVSIVKPIQPTTVALYQYATGFGQQENVQHRGFAATANVFCTRDQFKTVGPFNEELLSGGDAEWSWRATRRGLKISFEPRAIVYTEPRASLRGAVRQARRVAAGRMMLRNLGLGHIGNAPIGKQRSSWQAIIWILSNTRFSMLNRLRILSAALLIRIAAIVERCRLATGAKPERR